MSRAIVCGGRDYRDAGRVARVLEAAEERLGLTVIIQGGADGADRLAAEWGWDNKVAVATYNADWKKHGKKAGHMRNAEMIAQGAPDFVIAFPGGAGTADMVAQAEKVGLTVYKIGW